MMKKFLLLVIGLSTFVSLFAGGLVTNTNHSAKFARFLCRDATIGIDAVYFNPAGLNRLEDGFYLSLSNQIINQTQTIGNNYKYLMDPTFEYEGEVMAPIFPSFYAAYKKDNLVFSFGFNPIGGGGGAEFVDGLPSFEIMVADLVPGLYSELAPIDEAVKNLVGLDPGFRNVSGYHSNMYIEASSIYFGYQGNVSYEISDMVSLAIGARLVTAKDTYQGYVNEVTVDVPSVYGGVQTPGNYLRTVAGLISPPLDPNGEIIQDILGAADELDVRTNIEADVLMKGSGVTPIISLNVTPNEKVNLALKYEFKTKIDMTTTIKDGKDAGGLFTEGAVVVADMPAQLAVGAAFTPMDNLLISTGINYYFDKSNDYDGSLDKEVEMIDNNYWNWALGVEYGLSKMFSVSVGGSIARTGVNDLYQSDRRFSLNTNSIGGGFGIKVSDQLDLDLGGFYTIYEDGFRGYVHNLGQFPISVTETYDKSVWAIAIGVNYRILD